MSDVGLWHTGTGYHERTRGVAERWHSLAEQLGMITSNWQRQHLPRGQSYVSGHLGAAIDYIWEGVANAVQSLARERRIQEKKKNVF